MAIRIGDIKSAGTSYAELDDKMLVLDFQAGQPAAFVEIHRRYAPLAKHVCRRFLRNAADADEAFQETMIRVFQGLFRFNGQYALQPWIARIATNVSLDQLRSRARRPQVDDDALETHDHMDETNTPDQLVERLLERDLVVAVLADLPESHRRALVLRELEGRSHKEIADAMGVTPAQAKALIHRAKGSFRRAWLVRTAQRGGLAAFALMPVLWAMRLADGARRVADRVTPVGAAVQSAAPDVAVSATSIASPAAWSLGERAVAAGMTLLVAGGVTVGATSIARHRNDAQHASRVVAAPVAPSRAQATPAPDDTSRVEASSDDPHRVPPERDPRGEHRAITLPAGEPSPDTPIATETPPPGEAPEPPPSPSPGDDPGETPDGETGMPPPSAPAFSFSMQVSTSSLERCGCAGDSKLISSTVEPHAEGSYRFSQVVEGPAFDADGDAAWGFYLNGWGGVVGTAGEFEYRFALFSGAGTFEYAGSGALEEVVASDDGLSTTYRFVGRFALIDPATPSAGLPTAGEATATISVWADDTLFAGGLELNDAA